MRKEKFLLTVIKGKEFNLILYSILLVDGRVIAIFQSMPSLEEFYSSIYGNLTLPKATLKLSASLQ